MDKLLDAIIASAAANVAVLVLLLMVFILLYLLNQTRVDYAKRDDKLAAALTALAEVVRQLQLEFASRPRR